METSLASTLFAASPQAVIAIDQAGRVVAANPAAERLFGSDLVRQRRPVEAILPPLDPAVLRPGGADDLADPPAATRLTTRAPDGRRLDFELQCFHFEKDGDPFVALFLQDVTEPAAAERSLQALRTQIATNWRLNSLGELAALVAHELNQPLAAIANYLHIAATRSRDLTDIYDPIMQATAQAQRATETIRRFRSLTSRQTVNFEPVDAQEIVSEILPLLTLVTREADTELKIDVRHSRPIVCDRIQIQQVLLNLVRNAAEATRGRTAALVTIRFEQSGESALWSVSDTGCGVPDTVRRALFKPAASTKADGMGLGLSICRSIVEAHGGRIDLQRTDASGAAFTFRLPLAAA